jgi:hypothetical protein
MIMNTGSCADSGRPGVLDDPIRDRDRDRDTAFPGAERDVLGLTADRRRIPLAAAAGAQLQGAGDRLFASKSELARRMIARALEAGRGQQMGGR